MRERNSQHKSKIDMISAADRAIEENTAIFFINASPILFRPRKRKEEKVCTLKEPMSFNPALVQIVIKSELVESKFMRFYVDWQQCLTNFPWENSYSFSIF